MAEEESAAPAPDSTAVENEEKPADPPAAGGEEEKPAEESEAKTEEPSGGGENEVKEAEGGEEVPPEEAGEAGDEVPKDSLDTPKSAAVKRTRPTTAEIRVTKPADDSAAPPAEEAPADAPAETEAPPTGEAKTYEISVSCKNLRNKDFLSKSDPMCCVFRRYMCADWEEIGRTETVQDDLDPNFYQKIIFETNKPDQLLRFVVYDVDKPDQKLRAQDGLGSTEVALTEVQPDGTLTTELKDISNEKIYGMLHLYVQVINPTPEKVTLDIQGKGLSGKGLFAPKAIVIVSRKKADNDEFVVIYRTDECKGKEANWPPFVLPEYTFCGLDRAREIRFEVIVNKTPFGTVKSNLEELLDKSGKKGELKIEGSDAKGACLIVNDCRIIS